MSTPFTITVRGTYTREEIPYRCRKPRPVTHEVTTTATVKSVTSEQAPVAFRVSYHEDVVSDIRTYNNELYRPYLPFSQQEEPSTPGSIYFPSEVDNRNRHPFRGTSQIDSEDAYIAATQQHYDRFLIIDGIVWEPASEPGYHVVTFGLGGFNGSTALMVSSRKDHGMLFRADDFEAARAFAIETARERGDDPTPFIETPERYRRIEVLIPEAVTLVTLPPVPKHIQDLRFDYYIACGKLKNAKNPQEETKAFSEVTRLRFEIVNAGYTPVESDAQPYEARHLTNNA